MAETRTWGVELGHNTNAAVPGVRNHMLHITARVCVIR